MNWDVIRQGTAWLSDLFGLIQACAVSLGIAVGGVWTYRLFVRNRLAYPRAHLGLAIVHVPIRKGEARLIHVTLSISNTGDVLLKSNGAELRLRQVVPIPDVISRCAEGSCDPVPAGQTEIEWPVLAARQWSWATDGFEIEPGESDCLHADFMIPGDISVVELYCFVSNYRKRRSQLGWTSTELHSLKDSMEVKTMAEGTQESKSRLEEQQRQQKPQEPQQQQQPKPPDKSNKKE